MTSAAASVFEIPLTPGTPQTLAVSLAGTTYNLTLTWNSASACWILNIADASGNPIINGIPLVTGADLLAQYEYLDFGGSLYAQTDFDPGAVPAFANLGETGHLYFVPTS